LKAKQLQTSLQAEKQILASRMQHANAAADLHKQRVSRLEDQV
jgi:E3 ubiquitin-protein ligase BRE1